MQILDLWLTQVRDFLWGYPMIILLMGTHLFLTIRTRFVQRHLKTAFKLYVDKDNRKEGDISQFGALCVALAATIGSGNIIGVGTAVAIGGPGAVFWCWLTGVLGMATKYSEGLLAVKYRVRTEDGTMLGGPMYALERGLNLKWLAVLFCVFTAVAAFGIGNLVQGNSAATLVQENFGLPPRYTAVILTVMAGVTLLGGVKIIAQVCSLLVPFMAAFYIVGCLIILGLHGEYIWPSVKLIFSSAFAWDSMGGGVVGGALMVAMRAGVARGLFSNESGMGSAPIVAAAAQTKNSVRQALISGTGTFWDTVVICALTGLVIVGSMMASPSIISSDGALLTHAAFSLIPYIGGPVLTIALVTFVISTILGWSYYAERSLVYLMGHKAIMPYRVVWVVAVFLGCVVKNSLVWNFADCANALMAIPNVISLLGLSGVIVAETRYYLWEGRLDKHTKDKIPLVDK